MEQLLLKDICTFANGKAHEQYVDENGEYILVTSKFIASDGESYRRTSDRLTPLEVGDLCMVMSDVPKGRALAKCFLVDKNDIYTLNQRIGVFKADDRYLKKYFYYMLNRNRYFLSFDDGDSQTNLRKDDILNCPVICPSKEEQLEVIKILDGVALIIRQREEQLKYLDDLIKARFVELFGNPIYNSNNLPIKSLNDLGDWASGGTPSRTVPEYFEGDINWYSAGELNALFLEGSVEKITEEAIEKSAAKLFKAGSMLVGMYDTAAFKMGILKEDSASNQACACITPNSEVNIIWLYYELQLMKEHFLSQRRGVRQKNLNLGMIKGFEIPIAKRNQQDEFVDFVKQVDKSKVVVQKALDETKLLFDSLMQKYFG